MSVDFVALFIGKALTDSLKKKEEERLLIVSSGVRNLRQSSGVCNSKGLKEASSVLCRIGNNPAKHLIK